MSGHTSTAVVLFFFEVKKEIPAKVKQSMNALRGDSNGTGC